MEAITNIQEIKMSTGQIQVRKDPKQRKTMSVPEMRRLLGLKKTEGYWLVHRNFFKTEMINGQMRVDLKSFEKWYANQIKHKKVNGEEPGAELKKTSYSFKEAANLLGIHDVNLYEVWNKEKLETFTVDYVKRIPKDVFEKWYQNQDKYHKVDHIPDISELESDYIPLQDAAELLKITNKELVSLGRYGKYKDILDITVYDNKKWISKKSFQNFLNAQNEYKVIHNEKKEIEVTQGVIETKEYISREEAAVLAGVSSSTITKWMQAGKISCVGAGKVLRIHRNDFLQWIKKYSEGAE